MNVHLDDLLKEIERLKPSQLSRRSRSKIVGLVDRLQGLAKRVRNAAAGIQDDPRAKYQERLDEIDAAGNNSDTAKEELPSFNEPGESDPEVREGATDPGSERLEEETDPESEDSGSENAQEQG